jgi:signal transduction histidine kinase
MSVYRIVQEALTNVVKHAGSARTQVRIVCEQAAVRVVVVDDGGTGDAVRNGGAAGHGLLGMQERVAAFGGSLVAEPRREGGFQVAARLPYHRAAR